MVERLAFDAIVVEEDVEFTLADLCRACGTDAAQVFELVHEGVLDPAGKEPQEWVFKGPALRTTRTALRLATDLELGIAGAALVIELLREVEALRSRLRRAGIG